MALLIAAAGAGAALAAPAEHEFASDVAAIAAAPAPAPGGIVLVGSSIFKRWESCGRDLAPLPVVNRAFGGSRTDDQLFFFDKIVPTSRAAVVVWYCGSNDLNAKRTPETILQNTRDWVARTRAALPGARLVLVSVIRAPQKRESGMLDAVDAVNAGLRGLAGSSMEVRYVDVNPALETGAGEAVTECYLSDKLHLTPEGYRRMTSVLKPALEAAWKPAGTN